MIIILHGDLSDFPGLTSRPFQGFADIQEVECLGDSLPPESDVVLMLLYEKTHNKILAAMNMRKHECSTLEEYTSCDMVDSDSSKSRLRALITDLAEGQSRVYGCNISALISGIRMESFSWSITLHHISKFSWRYSFFCHFVCAYLILVRVSIRIMRIHFLQPVSFTELSVAGISAPRA